MFKRDVGIGLAGLLTAGALILSGCGSPEGAGTVDMAAVKKAAAQRGIPEGERTGASDSTKSQSAASQKASRNKPLPRGGR
jgi:hypothetical protein